ncbi:unnamed protein product, partial [Polarella glacialis]
MPSGDPARSDDRTLPDSGHPPNKVSARTWRFVSAAPKGPAARYRSPGKCLSARGVRDARQSPSQNQLGEYEEQALKQIFAQKPQIDARYVDDVTGYMACYPSIPPNSPSSEMLQAVSSTHSVGFGDEAPPWD